MDQPERHLELLALMARGSEAALAELYAVFKNRVYNTALSFLQDTAEAEEVTQDVFVKIYHAAARFEGKSSVSTWVYRITVNQSLSRLSYRNRQNVSAGSSVLHRKNTRNNRISTFRISTIRVYCWNKKKTPGCCSKPLNRCRNNKKQPSS